MANFFWDKAEMDRAGANPTILAIGDSWFWYPMPGGSLVNCLGEILQPFGHVIYAKGMNGAEAFDYVDGKYAASVREALRLYGRTPAAGGIEAVFLSGGGNDFAGFQDLRPMLKDDCSAEQAAAGCFRGGSQGIDAFIERMDEAYRRLIGVIYTRTSPGCRILMHSYDYAWPDGSGGWLQPALDHARVPRPLQRDCIVHLIDRFHAMQVAIAATDPGNLLVVDSRATLARDEWANELHPTGAGFQRIALECWAPVLAQAGLMGRS